jgi:hypothetical protein
MRKEGGDVKCRTPLAGLKKQNDGWPDSITDCHSIGKQGAAKIDGNALMFHKPYVTSPFIAFLNTTSLVYRYFSIQQT